MTFHTALLRVVCCELLVTHRYLELSRPEYKVAERILDACNSVNSQLHLWEHSPNFTEFWIEGQLSLLRPEFGRLEEIVEKAGRRLWHLRTYGTASSLPTEEES